MKTRIYRLFALVMLLSCFSTLKSQTMVDTVTYCTDFENFMDQGFWIMRNATTNKWCIGNATTNGGSYSMYISNDNGINNTMSATTTYSYAMRKIHFTAGLYDVSYDWKANGYNSTTYQYLRVFLIPTTASFTGGSLYSGLNATNLPANAISLDGNNALLLQPTWTTYHNPIVPVPTTGDYFIVFFWYNYNSTVSSASYQPPAAIDNICINAVSCPQPLNLSKNDLGNGSISLNWQTYGQMPIGWIIEYGREGFVPGTGTKITTYSPPPYTVRGLSINVTYDIYVRAICDSTDTSSYSEALKFRYCQPSSGCIDFTNLSGQGVVCTSGKYQYYGQYSPGTYEGPYADTGIIDYGADIYATSSSYSTWGSRHTVNTDPSLMDPLCPQISRIPPGECASVRLGSWYGGYICQSISYEMTVDTANADILLFKYACVFNDVNHGTTQQPRFVLEILDQNNNLISPTCGYADYSATDVSSGTVGGTWYTLSGITRTYNGVTGSGMTIRARDWTPLGLNIAAYHGQTISVRITSFSCGQSGPNHCGYVYYTLGCTKARIVSNNCGNNAQEATLSAPSGFNYRWYNSMDTTRTISTAQTITVSLDSSTYYCEVSFIDDPSCRFTMSTVAIPRFPHAEFSAQIDTTGCQYRVNVTNTSFTSISAHDLTNRIGDCEESHWYWGDGTDTISMHPRFHIYSQPGTYTIMLVSYISDGLCTDTAYFTVSFNPPVTPTIHGDSVVCTGTLARVWVELESGVSYQWSNGATSSSINVYPTDSITYTVNVIDYLGCQTNLKFHIDVDTVPQPNLQPGIFEACVPYSLSIEDISPANTTNTYSWIWGDGTSTANVNAPTHTYSEVGNYTMKCCIRSAEGCFDTNVYQVYVYGFAHGSFTWNPSVILGSDPTANFVNLTDPQPTNRYHWEFFNHENYQASSDDENPTYTWTGGSGEFSGKNLVRLITTNQVTTNSGGIVSCVDTVEAYVVIINDFLQFPNTVTANGDGINDIFEIKNLVEGGAYTDNELYIYNHWGRKVYHVQNISRREDFWDPAANGDVSGTYYYRFSAKGYTGNILRNGTVQVLTK